MESVYRKSLIRGEPAAGTLVEEPANHKGSQGGQSRSAFGQLFLLVSLHSCWTQCIRHQSGILNYYMNLRHVIHVICNMFFEHFRSRSLSLCIINGFNGSLVFLVICMLMNINKANTRVLGMYFIELWKNLWHKALYISCSFDRVCRHYNKAVMSVSSTTGTCPRCWFLIKDVFFIFAM